MSESGSPQSPPGPSSHGNTAKERIRQARDWAGARWRSVDWKKRFKRPSKKGLIWTGGIVGGVLVALILFLGLFDWNYFKGPVERFASARTGREVQIDGNLKVRLLSWTPSAKVEGLRIAHPAWVGKGDMANIKRLDVSVKLWPLLRGKVILPLLSAEQPVIDLRRDAEGRNNWTFKGHSPGEPARLPAIRRFDIKDGHLKIDDRVRKLKFTGTISSSEIVNQRTVQGFHLRGDGTLNSEDFKMLLIGGPLLNVDPNRPYPFNADIKAGATHIQAKGQIPKPFDFGVFNTSLHIAGQDAADLYYLTGLALPNTPPYRMDGQLTRNQRHYEYNRLTGRVGDSDLSGAAAVDTGERLFLRANLVSKSLDFDDLNALIGGAPSPAETISAKQKAMVYRAAGKLLPDAPLDAKRLRKMDAEVKYRAHSVRAQHFPVKRASVDLSLKNGVLTLNDLEFGFPRGQVAGRVVINAKQDTPIVDLDMRMTGARLEQFIPARAGNALEGALIGRAKLHGTGKSVHDAASTASGSVTLVVPRGEIREAFAELLGINVVRGLGLLWSKDQSQTEVRCAIADFQARNGVLHAQRLVLDTGPVLSQGSGQIDLRSERINLRLKGEAKEFRLIRLMAPITVQGTLKSPKIGVDAGKAAGQVGIAAAIGSLLAPLAAILPFVDPGLAEDANCQALINQAGTPAARPPQVAAGPESRSTARR